MAGVSIDTFGASFIKYLPGVRQTLNQTTNARRIPKGKLKWEGSTLEWYVHVQRNPAVGNIADGGSFPVAGKQGYAQARAGRRFTVGSVQITDGQLKNAASTKNAAISATESELTGLMTGIKKFENLMFTRDGTGTVALVGATASGATFTVDDARGLWDGKSYEIRDATTNTTIHDTFTVSSVARALSSGEAVVTPSATLAASGQATNDYVVWGTGNDSSWGRCLTGLDKMIDDASTTFQNINTATYPRYTSPVLSNGGTSRALTPSLFRQMLAMIKQESGDEPPQGMTVLTNCWSAINVEEMYEGELRLTPDTKTVGMAVASFQSAMGKVNIVTDPDCPYGKMFFVDPTELVFAEQAELDWRRDGPGGHIFKRNDSSAVFTATALAMNELVIMQRNKCGKIEDLTETKATAY